LEKQTAGSLPFTHIARVRVDGKETKDEWVFYLQPLRDHWVTVARGPPSDVIDAYGEFTKTMQKRSFSHQEWKAAIEAKQVGFTIVGIRYVVRMIDCSQPLPLTYQKLKPNLTFVSLFAAVTERDLLPEQRLQEYEALVEEDPFG
jgi:hypothetical protein